MKLKEVVFIGFEKKELTQIRQQISEAGDEDYYLGFGQQAADVIGADIAAVILPVGRVVLVKVGD